MGTKNNPSKFDCYSNAKSDEPMFILLGRDPQAAALVELWAFTREQRIEPPAVIEEARQCAKDMRDYCRSLGKESDDDPFGTITIMQKVSQLQATGKELEADIAALSNDSRLFVPGVWQCEKCHFVLTRTSIDATTGSFGTTMQDREETEPCPNDGTPMIRVSWEQRARELGKTCEEFFDEKEEFKKQRDGALHMGGIVAQQLRIAMDALTAIAERK